MKKLLATVCLLFAVTVFAEILTMQIAIQAGETKDIRPMVPWPAAYAQAYFSPAAVVNGEMTDNIRFGEGSKHVIVQGPTTVTITYETDVPPAPEPEPPHDPVTTPDAIGGGE